METRYLSIAELNLESSRMDLRLPFNRPVLLNEMIPTQKLLLARVRLGVDRIVDSNSIRGAGCQAPVKRPEILFAVPQSFLGYVAPQKTL